MLNDTQTVPDFPIHTLTSITEGKSGSDLKEMCRNAAMVPVREYMRDHMGTAEILVKPQLDVSNASALAVHAIED